MGARGGPRAKGRPASWAALLLVAALAAGCGGASPTGPAPTPDPGPPTAAPTAESAPSSTAASPAAAASPVGAPAHKSGPVEAGSTPVVVQPGDTLSRIAARYDLPVVEMLAANPQITDANAIRVGELIGVPGDFRIVDTLGSATPATEFDPDWVGFTDVAEHQNLGPAFTLNVPTRITEIGDFFGTPASLRVDIRRSVDGRPDPSAVVATFELWGAVRPEPGAAYLSAAPDVVLPPGTYFAMFAPSGGVDPGRGLVSNGIAPFDYRGTEAVFGWLDATSGSTWTSTDTLPARVLGRPASPTETPIALPAPTPQASLPPLTRTHVVAAGDTLWSIGQRYGLSVDQLLAANPQVADRSVIRVGERLTIPLHLLPIMNATLDLPRLPASPAGEPIELPGCLQGPVAFAGGYAFSPGAERTRWYESTWIDDVVQADVDHDSSTEIVALIRCQPSQGSFDRVVAFRERADGTFTTIDLVVQAEWADDWDPNKIEGIDCIDATPGGEVVVTVWALTCSCDRATEAPIWQDRIYAWQDPRFVQTAGSTTFVVRPGAADLAIERSIVFGTAVDGVRAGTPTVTVRNRGASAVDGVSVLLWSYDVGLYTRAIGRLEPGASATATFPGVASCRSGEACVDPFELQVHIGDQVYCHTQGQSCDAE